MGLLDGILSQFVGPAIGGQGAQTQASDPLSAILGSLGGGNQAQGGNLLAAAMSMLQQGGGLSSVLDQFRGNGMAAHADSWIGTGANMGLSGDQVQQVFGGSALGNIASQLGMSQGQASSAMAQILPELINQLTPGGQLSGNHDDIISKGLSLLRGSPSV
jgi:uncharacterized protein YidB (DUF937 family)